MSPFGAGDQSANSAAGDRPDRIGSTESESDLRTTIRIRRPRGRTDRKRLLLLIIGGLAVVGPLLLLLINPVPEPTSSPAIGGLGKPGTSTEIQRSSVYSSAYPDMQQKLVVLARDPDGAVLRNHHTISPAGGPWSGWQMVGGNAKGNPIVAPGITGELTAFWIGEDGRLWQNPNVDPGISGKPRPLGGEDLTGTPAVAKDSLGRFVVFARTDDGSLRWRYQADPSTGGWNDWETLSIPGGVKSDPIVQQDSEGKMRVFALGSDNRIVTSRQTHPNENSWNEHRRLPGAVTSAPSVAMDAQGRLTIIALDRDGAVRQAAEQVRGSGTWTRWQLVATPPVGRRIEGDPVVVSDNRSTLAVFVRADDGTLHHTYEVTSREHTWNDWVPLEGALNDILNVGMGPTSKLVVFGVKHDGTVEHMYHDGSANGWSDWTEDGLGGRVVAPR